VIPAADAMKAYPLLVKPSSRLSPPERRSSSGCIARIQKNSKLSLMPAQAKVADEGMVLTGRLQRQQRGCADRPNVRVALDDEAPCVGRHPE
jgi:hypothetical protein